MKMFSHFTKDKQRALNSFSLGKNYSLGCTLLDIPRAGPVITADTEFGVFVCVCVCVCVSVCVSVCECECVIGGNMNKKIVLLLN